jgi:hypothetical protein
MRRIRVPFFIAGCAAILAVLGGASGRSLAGAGPRGDLPMGSEPVDLDPATFSATIDNPYWPMEPGKRWTYREIGDNGKRRDVMVTVSTETKRTANGVTARVVRDTVTSGGIVIEDTLDWYAQDGEGNVWYLGEKTAEFRRGKVSSRAGSWEAGVDGALPGVVVPAHPVVGMRYRQEYYAGHAEDDGEVLSVDEQVEVPAGHFVDALLTKDTNALEPKVLEYKLYALGTGPVLAVDISGGADREELVEMTRVGTRAARAAGTVALGSSYP